MVSCDRGDCMRTVTQTIVNICGDWGDRDRWDRPCSILASLSLLRLKTAITKKIGGHEFALSLKAVIVLLHDRSFSAHNSVFHAKKKKKTFETQGIIMLDLGLI